MSLNNQQCMTQPTLTNLHCNEYYQGLRYYLFAVNLNRYIRSSNNHSDLSNRKSVSNETEDLNLNVFNMISKINESKTLAKHISYKCECKFSESKCNLHEKWNKDKCRSKCKNKKKTSCAQNIFFLESCYNGKYIRSFYSNSVIM